MQLTLCRRNFQQQNVIKTCLSEFISSRGKPSPCWTTGWLFGFSRRRLTLVEGLKQASSFSWPLIWRFNVSVDPPHGKFTWQSRIYSTEPIAEIYMYYLCIYVKCNTTRAFISTTNWNTKHLFMQFTIHSYSRVLLLLHTM